MLSIFAPKLFLRPFFFIIEPIIIIKIKVIIAIIIITIAIIVTIMIIVIIIVKIKAIYYYYYYMYLHLNYCYLDMLFLLPRFWLILNTYKGNTHVLFLKYEFLQKKFF
jgi:hypothetical protein